jgi:hypothetical protein
MFGKETSDVYVVLDGAVEPTGDTGTPPDTPYPSTETIALSEPQTDTVSAETTISIGGENTMTDYGIFDDAYIEVEHDKLIARVIIPVTNGKVTIEGDERLIAAWATDNIAGAVLTESKKHKPE